MPSFKNVKNLLKFPSLQDKFDKRAKEVLVEIDKMPKGSAYTAYLKESLDDAKKLSQYDLKDAYAELKRIKKDAKMAVNGYSDGPSVDNLARMIDNFNLQGDLATGRLNTVRTNMDEIYNDIKNLPKVKSLKTIDEKLAVKARLSEYEQDLFIKYIGQNYAREQVLDYVSKVDVVTTAANLDKQIGLLSKKKKKDADALKKTLQNAKNKFRISGKYLTTDHAETIFKAQHDKYREQFKKWVDSFTEVKPQPDSFADLEKKDRERLERAMKDYKEGAIGDKIRNELFSGLEKRPPTDLATWESSPGSTDFMNDILIGDIKTVDNSKVLMACTNIRQKTTELIKTLTHGGVDSDVVFDMSLKSEAELEKYIADSLGVPLKQATPDQKALFEKLAEAMSEEIRKSNPNKTSDKMSSLPLVKDPSKTCDVPEEITIGGVEFKNPKVIGEGGLGAITEYTDQDGNAVIVKTAKIDPNASAEDREEKRQEMVQELKMHRQIMGGEAGGGNENVIAMKGVAVSPDGSMHMVMEKADGGDCKQVGNNLIYVTESGIISQEVRNAMNKDMIGQAIKGLKHMQKQNMVHHDIKAENYLVDENGTVKLADFGSSHSADAEGSSSTRGVPTTKVYEAPEMKSEPTVTGKADTYTLGTMIASIISPSHGMDRLAGLGKFDTPDFKGKTGSTALDRMMNAMLDPDPNKRPTLEAIEASFFLDSDEEEERNLEEIKKLNIEIGKKVGRSVGKKQEELNKLNSEYKLLEGASQLPTDVRSDEDLTKLLNTLSNSKIRTEKAAKNLAERKKQIEDEKDPKKRDVFVANLDDLTFQVQKENKSGLETALRAKAVLLASPNPDQKKMTEVENHVKTFETNLDEVMKQRRKEMEDLKAGIQVEMDKPEVKILVDKLKEASANFSSGKKKSILHNHYTSREIRAFKQKLTQIEQSMAVIPEDESDKFDTDYRKAHAILVLEKITDEKAAKDLKKNLADLEKNIKKALLAIRKDYDARSSKLSVKVKRVKDEEIGKSYTDALKTAANFAKMKSYRVALRVLDRLEGALEEGVHMNADKVALV